MRNRNRTLWTVIIAAALLLCCYCLCIALIGAYFIARPASVQTGRPSIVVTRVVTVMVAPRRTATPTATASTPAVRETSSVTATRAAEPQTPEAAPSVTPAPTGEAMGTAEGALPPVDAEAASLYANEMPAADPRALAMRLKPGAGEIPLVVNGTAPTYKVGDVQEFSVSNNDTQEHQKIKAELKYMTDHVAVWVEQGVRFNQRDLETSAKRFEEKTYPTDREFFAVLRAEEATYEKR